MATYRFSGFSEAAGCYMVGRLQAEVTGPAGRASDAEELANLMTNGYSRRAAGDFMMAAGEGSAKGLRVLNFGRVA